MARGKPTDEALKAQALGALMAGRSISEVSRETGVPVATLHRWRGDIGEEMEKVGKEKRGVFASMIGDSFQRHVEALNQYATHTSTPEYIRTQAASEIATLHVAVGGYALRLLDIAARVGLGRTDRPTG